MFRSTFTGVHEERMFPEEKWLKNFESKWLDYNPTDSVMGSIFDDHRKWFLVIGNLPMAS